uniref:Cytochrome b5 heme-binding domain-containing protein n=1 Tax=Trieres chinensis TaxID=1514140 RepID=A0A7S1ZS28_TRICV|mmetsp:Transcript_31837/g.65034  ORF Transcript_31837/g.65034 Transcript_31837/m.65034 type:complete len:246 (+) Transcript_31837:71-808(+)|eukprot:CAMPEP_0183326388 /NCGR_PEP_ID=MMETSP0160_2-20130417/82027_1 /TAXON_ID=2839 ORGANISM="Odontella Sinensis, Strain Grunow 1884" /NCGR_SAMPLE_ID=MMETSP0160_2 /ASSEMBLY_ACC=CAM_ASM_000250 /LENGTH=245 /DNA_ID=CAMNT_0025494361 /DNA_START=194 /DNA_END=931 /DNA_ORIENTATION=+
MQRRTDDDQVDEPDPLNNFTSVQLLHFDGGEDSVGKKKGEKPVYLSVKGVVYDASKGRHLYGPGGPFEVYAGRECGAALARGSLDQSDLDNISCDDLSMNEQTELEGWVERLKSSLCYPVLGRLIPGDALPSEDRVVSKEELAQYDGKIQDIPEGYAAAPIYLAAKGKVYDMSFGGVSFYGKGGAYNCFAGKDASRALAKMSLDPADTENTSTSDLSEKEIKVLNDWVKTFEERKKYPCVGRLGE